MTIYYLYVLGYTGVIVFQFNRCFTTNVHAHILVIISSAIAGFLLGCILHAVPATADWLYSDVLAQNCAAVLAAVGTLAWSWSNFSTPAAANLTRAAVKSSQRQQKFLWAQPMLRADAEDEFKTLQIKSRKVNGVASMHDDGSLLAQKISEILHKSHDHQNAIAKEAPWSSELIGSAFAMWMARRVRVLAVDRESFSSVGLGDTCSFSQVEEDDILVVKVGLLGKIELRSPSWQPLLATVSAEAVLYHVARVEHSRSHAQAVQAEHFLHKTTTISKRIEVELALGSAVELKRVILKSNTELMRHLCCEVDVESNWQSIPQSGREAIISRITGQPVAFSEEFRQWMTKERIDLQTIDFHLYLCFDIFQNCVERYISTVFFSDGDCLGSRKPVTKLKAVSIPVQQGPSRLLQHVVRALTAAPLSMVKWVAVIAGGGANIERELCHSLGNVFCNRLVI